MIQEKSRANEIFYSGNWNLNEEETLKVDTDSQKEQLLSSMNGEQLNINQKWDPLRAMKTFIRRKVGHTT